MIGIESLESEPPDLALFEPTLCRLTDLALNKGIEVEAIESEGWSVSLFRTLQKIRVHCVG